MDMIVSTLNYQSLWDSLFSEHPFTKPSSETAGLWKTIFQTLGCPKPFFSEQEETMTAHTFNLLKTLRGSTLPGIYYVLVRTQMRKWLLVLCSRTPKAYYEDNTYVSQRLWWFDIIALLCQTLHSPIPWVVIQLFLFFLCFLLLDTGIQPQWYLECLWIRKGYHRMVKFWDWLNAASRLFQICVLVWEILWLDSCLREFFGMLVNLIYPGWTTTQKMSEKCCLTHRLWILSSLLYLLFSPVPPSREVLRLGRRVNLICFTVSFFPLRLRATQQHAGSNDNLMSKNLWCTCYVQLRICQEAWKWFPIFTALILVALLP